MRYVRPSTGPGNGANSNSICLQSFCTVPLAVLHSLAAWQYNKVVGFGDRKTSLHAACTYLLRLTVAVWLASSVAGLVVVAQQASCLPEGADGSFWEVGISCGLHRTVFIVSVVSLYVLPFVGVVLAR